MEIFATHTDNRGLSRARSELQSRKSRQHNRIMGRRRGRQPQRNTQVVSKPVRCSVTFVIRNANTMPLYAHGIGKNL